ncbi:MAG: CBS domain-containing protein [Candidatus Marsarchaeota archaeon]|nr:CBS domain-containing protein [Candidatus Marsarchaeota archaeon]
MQEIYGKPLTETEARSLVVRDIMSYPVVTTHEKASIREVAKLMKKHNVDAVVMTDKSGAPSGIITEGDIVRRLVSTKRNLWFVKAAHVMSKPLITVSRDMSIEDAAKFMAEKKIKKLCVVDQGRKLIGMLTTEDITKNAGYLINVLQEVIHTGYYMGLL